MKIPHFSKMVPKNTKNELKSPTLVQEYNLVYPLELCLYLGETSSVHSVNLQCIV